MWRLLASGTVALVALLLIPVGTVLAGPNAQFIITIDKSAAPPIVLPGQNINYTITVTNPGAVIIPNPAVLTDTIPAGTTYVAGSVVGPAGWACVFAAGVITCTNPLGVPPGANIFTFSVTVNPGFAGPVITNTAVLTRPGATFGPCADQTPCSATVTTGVQTPTPTPTTTSTATSTATGTATSTTTATATGTATATATGTATATATGTVVTVTPTSTATPTATGTVVTATPTATPTATGTVVTATPTATLPPSTGTLVVCKQLAILGSAGLGLSNGLGFNSGLGLNGLNPPSAIANTFTFTTPLGGPTIPSITIPAGQLGPICGAGVAVAAGTVAVTEVVPAGFTLTSVTGGTLSGTTATATITSGQTTTLTFINDPLVIIPPPPPLLPPPPPPILFPPPPPLLPPPPLAPPMAAPQPLAPPAGVPVIPEADSVLLVVGGLVALGGLVGLHSLRRRRGGEA